MRSPGSPDYSRETEIHVAVDAVSRRQSVGRRRSRLGGGQCTQGTSSWAMYHILYCHSLIVQQICQLSEQGTLERTSAIPGGDIYTNRTAIRPDRTQRRRIVSILGYHLPPLEIMGTLLEEYSPPFIGSHWLSMSPGVASNSSLSKMASLTHCKGRSFSC